MEKRVDILLATYNGEKYLREQIDSLLAQSYTHIRIIARDDGSTDQTPAILQHYAAIFPDKFQVLGDDRANLGPTGNFQALMRHSTAPYVAFSDQDDQWLPEKIAVQLQALQALEADAPEVPAYVFCDLMYCGSDLQVLHPSLNQKDQLNPTFTQAHRLLMQNVPYGCAMLINRALLEAALPVPPAALLHDHWLALCAALTGKTAYVPKALIRHRVHDSNASRAASQHKKEAENKLQSKLNNANFHNYLFKQTAQAEALLRHFEGRLDAAQVKMLQDFIALKSTSGWKRKQIILKNLFFKNTFVQTLKLLIRA